MAARRAKKSKAKKSKAKKPRRVAPKKRRRAAPKKRRRASKRRAAPKKRGHRLALFRRHALTPALLSNALVLVVSGALGGERLSLALAAQETLARWLEPVATPTAVSAWSRQWRWRRRPVDADTILQALAAVAPELDVGDSLALSFGVVDEKGAYVPLAFRSHSLVDALDEARANARVLRARYSTGQQDGREPREKRGKTTFYELGVE